MQTLTGGKLMLIKPTTDKTLPWVDYSTLSAVNTCPRWGLIHSWHGKHLSAGVERVLPLEAGRAMHDVFACARIFDALSAHTEQVTAINQYANRLFASDITPNRWQTALEYYNNGEDAETRCMQMALSLLETSGYHDDPRDTKRTQANLESAAISYIQRYPLGRFIPIIDAKTNTIGVEVPFDITLQGLGVDVPDIRLVGRVDGVCIDALRKSDLTPEVHENKTGSRIDTVWSSSFDTSHQVTGYCVAMSCVLSMPIHNVTMWGLQIPVPKASSYSDGIMRYPTSRTDEMIYEWAEWVIHTLDIIKKYQDDPTNAPMYTHSCNRYFRACSLIPLCTENRERRLHIFNNEMQQLRWSPLEQEIMV